MVRLRNCPFDPLSRLHTPLVCGVGQAIITGITQMGSANITYEDVNAAADENGRTVAETLDIVDRAVAKDRGEHAQEYEPVS